MRLIFFSLLCIVLGYFVWNQWGVPWYESIDHQSQETLVVGDQVKSLVLLSERAEPELPAEVMFATPAPVLQVTATPQLESRPVKIPGSAISQSRSTNVQSAPSNPPVATDSPRAPMICREFGPFTDAAEAERFRSVVGVGGEVFERQVKKASAQWLVLTPTAAGVVSPSAELMAFLEQQGLFMSRTGLQGESAIGPFVSEKVAASYQQRLQEIGVVTRLHSADESEKEFWLRSEFQTEQLALVSAAFNGYLGGSQEQGITQLVCN